MAKFFNIFRRKKGRPPNQPGRVFALPIPATIHSSIINLASLNENSIDELPGGSHQGPAFRQQRVPHLPRRPLSVLSADDYEHLILAAIDATTSQDNDSSDDQTYLKTVVSEEGQIDLRSDSGRFDSPSTSSPPVPGPRFTSPASRDQLGLLYGPNNTGVCTAGAVGCAPDIQGSRYSQVVREHQYYPQMEHAVNQPLPNPRSRPVSLNVPRAPRTRPTPPIPRRSMIQNQEGSSMHPLKSDDSQSVADAVAYREFVEGPPPVQPAINVFNNSTVTIHQTVLIGQEHWPLISNILTNHQHQVSPPIRETAPGPKYDPRNYVEGAPKARQEAMYRRLAFSRNPREVVESF